LKSIDAIVLIKEPQGRLQALGEAVQRGSVQAFVVNAVEFEDKAGVSGFGKKDLRTHKAEEVDHRIE
jgi:hypothetical protein